MTRTEELQAVKDEPRLLRLLELFEKAETEDVYHKREAILATKRGE